MSVSQLNARHQNPPTQGLGSGSFNKLVAALTSDKALDSAYMKAFIATYRSFATPWQLLEKMVQRYNVPKTMPPERGLPIKLRVSVVIKCATPASLHTCTVQIHATRT